MRELVIDITYLCNSNCNYCQWSVSNSIINRLLPVKQLLVPNQTLIELEISRIVLTGGEPILSENLMPVLEYYKNLNFPIRLLSNGIELDSQRIYRTFLFHWKNGLPLKFPLQKITKNLLKKGSYF